MDFNAAKDLAAIIKNCKNFKGFTPLFLALSKFFRSAFWPIHGYEVKKFVPLAFMMLLILFVYALLRSLKDSLVIPFLGAEALPFLKFYLVLPAAILFFVAYTRLLNRMRKEYVFYVITSFFVAFFILFALVLYPNQSFFHPSPETFQKWVNYFPSSFYGFLLVIKAWSFSLFYVISDLWGAVMLSLLFWQFANDITKTKEAKRFYAMFGLIAQFALIFAGGIVFLSLWLQKKMNGLEQDTFLLALNISISAIIVAALLMSLIYRWMHLRILTDPFYYKPRQAKVSKGKQKLSVRESMNYILYSRHLGYIAILMMSYALSIGLIEVIWKDMLRTAYPTSEAYYQFMGQYQIALGLTALLTVLFMKGIVDRFGWYRGAMITPLMMLVTFVIFFTLALFGDCDIMNNSFLLIGVTPLFAGCMVGAAQNILTKATKYSLFDPTKEMAYIPLDNELKTKGKAAVDVVGYRLGKGSTGLIASMLIMNFGTVANITPYVAVIIGIVIFAWIFAVKKLNKLYHQALKKTNEADLV